VVDLAGELGRQGFELGADTRPVTGAEGLHEAVGNRAGCRSAFFLRVLEGLEDLLGLAGELLVGQCLGMLEDLWVEARRSRWCGRSGRRGGGSRCWCGRWSSGCRRCGSRSCRSGWRGGSRRGGLLRQRRVKGGDEGGEGRAGGAASVLESHGTKDVGKID